MRTVLLAVLAFFISAPFAFSQEEPPFGPTPQPPSPPSPSARCGNYTEIEANLFAQYNEVPTSVGVREGRHSVLTLFESISAIDKKMNKQPTWTLLTTRGTRLKEDTCVVTSGIFWKKNDTGSLIDRNRTLTPPDINKEAISNAIRVGQCGFDTSPMAIIKNFEDALDQPLREGVVTTNFNGTLAGVLVVLAAQDGSWTILSMGLAPNGGVRGCVGDKGVEWQSESPPKDIYIEVAR